MNGPFPKHSSNISISNRFDNADEQFNKLHVAWKIDALSTRRLELIELNRHPVCVVSNAIVFRIKLDATKYSEGCDDVNGVRWFSGYGSVVTPTWAYTLVFSIYNDMQMVFLRHS